MDLKSIIGTVTGGVILAWLGTIQHGLSESKHNDDIQNVHLEYLKKSDEKQWGMLDEFTFSYIKSLLEDNEKLKDENQDLRDGK